MKFRTTKPLMDWNDIDPSKYKQLVPPKAWIESNVNPKFPYLYGDKKLNNEESLIRQLTDAAIADSSPERLGKPGPSSYSYYIN